jgi:WD40 repeat protein
VPVRTWAAGTGLWLALLCAGEVASGQVLVTQGPDLSVDVSKSSGQLVIDLAGSIWLLQPSGGAAVELQATSQPARRPRWSPDGRQILYQTTGTDTSELWLIDIASGQNSELGVNSNHYQNAAWHPDGERIVFSSDRRGSGLDIWEMDLHSGVEWRLSDGPGDETEAAWSADGRHLVYVRQDENQWTLVLRRFGEPDVDLIVSDATLAAPSWRPDGTLITFLKKIQDDFVLQMIILSEPLLERQFGAGQDYLGAPVSWLDRETIYYASGGLIKTRGFGEWRDRTIHFRALVGKPDPFPALNLSQRELPLITPPKGKLVIRSTRLFDGISRGYRNNLDVLVDGGVIESVVPRQDWPDITVLDIGNTTLLPGFIDSYSAIPGGSQLRAGAEMLSYGVTTMVSAGGSNIDAKLWEDEQNPGPRLLPGASLADSLPSAEGEPIYLVAVTASEQAGPEQRDQASRWQEHGTPVFAENWVTGRSIGASVLLAADMTPESPTGNYYLNLGLSASPTPFALVSGLADAGTPGLTALFDSRQAAHHADYDKAHRRLPSRPNLAAQQTSIVLGSKPNGLPAGLSLHAELRALSASGLRGDQVLKTAGQNAARVLGLEGKIGQITPGARADLVLVSGDPLVNVADALNIVAVVRNGRFFSLVSLLERAQAAKSVE